MGSSRNDILFQDASLDDSILLEAVLMKVHPLWTFIFVIMSESTESLVGVGETQMLTSRKWGQTRPECDQRCPRVPWAGIPAGKRIVSCACSPTDAT